jgi:hypothetical protein
MDGDFACPECGTSVKVGGIAPGRQVRCDFCGRLLEVPFLPRATDAPWKRQRFTRPRWLYWAWSALAIAVVAVLATGGYRLVRTTYHSAKQRSINQLLESSREHEAVGRLDQALFDLDTALEVARGAGAAYVGQLAEWQKKRKDLAIRDAQGVLGELRRAAPGSFTVGNWLNLEARAARDPDLSSLRTTIASEFQSALTRQVDYETTGARQDADQGKVVSALMHCDRVAPLLEHLASEKRAQVGKATEELVTLLVSTNGVRLATPQGRFIFGAHAYATDLVPVVIKALEFKQYLPYRESGPWQHCWIHARYRVTLEIEEVQEGTYLSTANRQTRIELRLALWASDQQTPIFKTTPTARSRVPLPKLPVYISNRLASSGDRSAEVERLLYDDARGQIDEKLSRQLSNMPACAVPR